MMELILKERERERAPRRPLRVLHLVETLGRGGAERNLINVLRHLPRGEHAVCYLRPPSDFAEELRALGVPVRCLDFAGPADSGRVLYELREEIVRGAFSLVFTQVFLADVLGRLAGAAARVPVLSSVQTVAYEAETLSTYSLPGRWKTRLVQQPLDALSARLYLARFVAVSRFVAEGTRRALRAPAEQVVVVPNSVDLAQFRPASAAERRRVREALGLSGEVLLFVGKLNRGKGCDLLIRALPRIRRAVPTARLCLLGQGPDEERLARLAAGLAVKDAVLFPGQQADVLPYLQAADLFVFPSRFEGLPLSVLEAMACGLPCALSSIPPHREVTDGGHTALLLPEDPAAWAQGVLHLLSRPAHAQHLAHEARGHVERHFSARVVAQKLDALFQKEARERPAGLLDWLLQIGGGP